MLEPWASMPSTPRDRWPAKGMRLWEVLETEMNPTGKQVPAKGSILFMTVRHRLSPIVAVQRYILQLGNAWRVTQRSQAEPPVPQRSHHDEVFLLPVEQACLLD